MYSIVEVSALDVVFGCKASDLMPSYEAVPDKFKNGNTKWNKLFSDWFFSGLKKLELIPKENVDKNKALLHIRAIMGSFEPQHEHKEAGIAFLLSEWFEDAKWEK